MSGLNTKSILYQLDPRLKIVVMIVLTMVIFTISDWWILALLVLLSLGLVKLAKLPLAYCLKKLRSPAIMVVFMLVLQLLMTFHIDALWHGLFTFLRLMIFMMFCLVLVMTTTQTAFILSLESALQPLSKMGFKTGAILLTFRIIQRFVPSLMQEANKILKAQASRGLDIKNANLWMKMRLMIALLLPVFVVAIKRADDLGNTMAVRGYVLNQARTPYRTLRRMK